MNNPQNLAPPQTACNEYALKMKASAVDESSLVQWREIKETGS